MSIDIVIIFYTLINFFFLDDKMIVFELVFNFFNIVNC